MQKSFQLWDKKLLTNSKYWNIMYYYNIIHKKMSSWNAPQSHPEEFNFSLFYRFIEWELIPFYYAKVHDEKVIALLPDIRFERKKRWLIVETPYSERVFYGTEVITAYLSIWKERIKDLSIDEQIKLIDYIDQIEFSQYQKDGIALNLSPEDISLIKWQLKSQLGLDSNHSDHTWLPMWWVYNIGILAVLERPVQSC